MRQFVVPIASSFCLAACANAPIATDAVAVVPVHAGDEFKLVLGRGGARLGDSDVFLWFEEVTEDSRCAKGVACVWEGNARARFRVRADGNDEFVELNTSTRFETRRRIAIGTVVLRGIDPRPPVPDPGLYVATLRVEADAP